jgi:long-chain fatty acid transport protein
MLPCERRPARRPSPVIVTLIGCVMQALCLATAATAQSTDDDSVFDFSLPGARSRGMGGAFVAIADDATSVYSNPAGLTSLFRPEVSFEFRHWTFRSPTIDHGHAYGPPTMRGIDVESGIHDREFSSGVNGISFLSFAYPRDKWALGVFHHQLARYQMDKQTAGIFFNCSGGRRGPNAVPPFCDQSQVDGVDRLFPAAQSFDLSIRSTGVTLGVESNLPRRLAVGVTLQVFTFSLDATRKIYAARDELKYAAARYLDSDLELTGRRTGDDLSLGVNAGFLYDLNEQLTVGATFRQGPKFHYLADTTTGEGNIGPANITFINDLEGPFKVPDTWALGIAYRPSNAWRIGFEYDRVMYSQLIEQVTNTAHGASDPEGQLIVERLTLNDGDQFRLGGEYSTTAQGWLLSVRAGGWYDPPHRPYLALDDPNTGFPAPGWSLLFPKRDGDMHWSGGFGVASARHLQFDFAVDVAPSVTIYAVSAIYRF